MKNLAAFLIVLVVLLPACSVSTEKTPGITLNDSTCIMIIADNVNDTITVTSSLCSYFPFRPCNYKQIEIVKPGIYYLTYRMTKPELVKFEIGDHFQALLIPSDTFEIHVGHEKKPGEKPSLYHKINNRIYDYYAEKKKQSGYYSFTDIEDLHFEKYLRKMEITTGSFNEALDLLDTYVEKNLKFLKGQKDLPAWFRDLEKANIIYGSEYIRSQLDLRLRPADRVSARASKAVLYNRDAYLSSLYYFYLNNCIDYRFPIENPDMAVTSWKIKQFAGIAHFLDSLPTQEIKDYFITCKLADLYFFSRDADAIEEADAFIAKEYPKLSGAQLRFINNDKNYMKSLLGLKGKLPAGDKAPGFFLKDTGGRPYEMSSFKNKCIYLHFWATWCGPCLDEIPSINKLHSSLGNSPVEIVNICLDGDSGKWKEIVESRNLKGLNLACKGNWEKALKRSYFITELPHYTLVDRDGLIVENKCSGPDEIKAQIEKLIALAGQGK